MALELDRIQAVFFDLDGTLRDTDNQYTQRVASVLRYIAWLIPGSDTTRIARWLVMKGEGPVNRLIAAADRHNLDGAMHRFFEWANPWRHRREGRRYILVPGAEGALQALVGRYPLALVTTRGQSSTKRCLDATGLGQYFKAIADGTTTTLTKPFPDPVLWAAEQLQIAPEACVMVGDMPLDVISAKAAGAQAIGVLSGFGQEAELLESGADLILPSVAALPAALG